MMKLKFHSSLLLFSLITLSLFSCGIDVTSSSWSYESYKVTFVLSNPISSISEEMQTVISPQKRGESSVYLHAYDSSMLYLQKIKPDTMFGCKAKTPVLFKGGGVEINPSKLKTDKTIPTSVASIEIPTLLKAAMDSLSENDFETFFSSKNIGVNQIIVLSSAKDSCLKKYQKCSTAKEVHDYVTKNYDTIKDFYIIYQPKLKSSPISKTVLDKNPVGKPTSNNSSAAPKAGTPAPTSNNPSAAPKAGIPAPNNPPATPKAGAATTNKVMTSPSTNPAKKGVTSVAAPGEYAREPESSSTTTPKVVIQRTMTPSLKTEINTLKSNLKNIESTLSSNVDKREYARLIKLLEQAELDKYLHPKTIEDVHFFIQATH